jgi:hypothetical protein
MTAQFVPMPADLGQVLANPGAYAEQMYVALTPGSVGGRVLPAEGDETARILAVYGTAEKRCEYALLEADRAKRVAYAAARAVYEAAG